MRGSLFCCFVLAGVFACGKSSRYVAIENVDADARVVIAVPSNGDKEIRALARSEPYSHPLKDVFAEEGGTLRVYVFAFSAARLAEAFPALAGKSTVELVAALKPAFGAPGPGAYAVPEPDRALFVRVDADSDSDLAYTNVSFDEIQRDEELRFVFALDAAVACAPGENAFRAFSHGAPEHACAFTRNTGCAWTPPEGTCSALRNIFDRVLDPSAAVRELPSGELTVAPEDARCPPGAVAARDLGETRSWVCVGDTGANVIVSIQDTPRATDGMPWVPAVQESVNLLQPGGLFVQAPKGLVYAFVDSDRVRLRRIEAMVGQLDVSDLVFAAGQFPIDISIPLTTGDPNGVALGSLERLTTNSAREQIVVDGALGTFVLLSAPEPSADRPALAFYTRPIEVGRTIIQETREGDVISGAGTNLYALVSNGITVLRLQNNAVSRAGTTPAGTVSFQRGNAPQIAAARRGGVDRAVVWERNTQGENQVYIFNESGALITSCAFSGEIKTVLDGPKLVRIPEGSRFEVELVDLDRVEGGATCTDQSLITRYLVPPMASGATGALETADSAYFADNNQLAYWYASSAATSYAGVLDLASGLSQAINLGIAIENGALFEDVGETEVFGLFGEPSAQQFKSFRIPALAR